MGSLPTRRPGVPAQLWQCDSADQQRAWVRQQLENGRTLTEPYLWLGGCDDPKACIRTLRQQGMVIETEYVLTVDAGGTRHPRTPAWRQAVSGTGQASARDAGDELLA